MRTEYESYALGLRLSHAALLRNLDRFTEVAARERLEQKDDLAAFVGRHAQELAGAAERDQAVDALGDLEVDQAPQGGLVDPLAVGGERRDQHGIGAAKLLHVVPLGAIVNLLPCA